MQRRTCLLAAAGLAAPLAGPLAARAQGAQGSLVLKLGHQFSRGSIPDRVAHRLAEAVLAQSRGAVRVEVFADATFGDEREHLALLRRGALDLAITGDLVVTSLGDEYLPVNMPFAYRDVAHALAIYDGPLGQALRGRLAQGGLQVLGWHHVGTRMLTAQRAVPQMRALRGLRLRLPPDAAWGAVWRALGATVVPLPFTELATALRLGKVDAQENPPNFVRAGRLFENQRFLMTTAHMPQRQLVLASGPRLARWSRAQRQAVEAAAAEATAWAVRTAQAEHEADLAWLLAEGRLQPVEFDPSGIAALLPGVARALGGPAALAVYEQIQQAR